MDLAACLALTRSLDGSASLYGPQLPSMVEIEALLDYTRAVAHASERKAAPVAAYAVGVAYAALAASERVALLRRAAAAIDAASGDPR